MTFWEKPSDLPKSRLQAVLENRLHAAGLGGFSREYYFARPRRWRFDIAFVKHLVAIEVEGGGWVNGRHVRGSGFARDLRKYGEAAARGWIVLRVDGAMIEDNSAVEYAKRILSWRGE